MLLEAVVRLSLKLSLSLISSGVAVSVVPLAVLPSLAEKNNKETNISEEYK